MGQKLKGKDAVISGLAQGLSILPGISRSGITMFALLMLGYPGTDTLTLSFLMAIPALSGFTFIDLCLGNYGEAFFPIHLILLAIAVSFVSGLLTIKYFIKLSEKVDFKVFCWLVGAFMALSSVFLLI